MNIQNVNYSLFLSHMTSFFFFPVKYDCVDFLLFYTVRCRSLFSFLSSTTSFTYLFLTITQYFVAHSFLSLQSTMSSSLFFFLIICVLYEYIYSEMISLIKFIITNHLLFLSFCESKNVYSTIST
jgi:hypothetical protein